MRITPFGDAALLVEDEQEIASAVNARVLAAARLVRAAAPPGVRDVVPAFASFVVHFDPLGADVPAVHALIERCVEQSLSALPEDTGPTREIPVCYGGEFGPDLAEVAAWARCDPDAVIAAHAAPVYRVFMLGFLPGFPYMGMVNERIAMPRRDTPRARVVAGSVGIAGRQTGVYPFDSPGGWQIIGRTPIVLFDSTRQPPALASAGQAVRFRSVTRAEYDAIAGAVR